jgi:hypothetical protein
MNLDLPNWLDEAFWVIILTLAAGVLLTLLLTLCVAILLAGSRRYARLLAGLAWLATAGLLWSLQPPIPVALAILIAVPALVGRIGGRLAK